MKSSPYAKLSKRFHSSLLHISIIFISLQYCSAAPVDSKYVTFINDLNTRKCTTPEQIQLPTNSSDQLEKLSTSLVICQNLENAPRTRETQYLCDEIYESLKVVLCPNSEGLIKPLNVTLSNQVCKDISLLKDVPESFILLKKLADGFFCDLMCDAVFEKACQVLLWSYQSQAPFTVESAKTEKLESISTQEGLQDTGKPQEQSPSEEKENHEAVQGQVKTSDQPISTAIIHTQKSSTVSEQTPQKTDQTQPNDIESKILNRVNLEQNLGTGVLSINPNNEFKNHSFNLSPKVVEEILHANDLPDDAGPAEIEEPHDDGDVFHNAVITDKESFQNSVIEKHLSNDLTHLTGDVEKPKRPDVPLPPALPERPALNGFLEPHEGEELGELETLRNNPDVQELRNTLAHFKTTKNEELVPTPKEMATNQTSSSTTNDASKSPAIENKATDPKTSIKPENNSTPPKSSTVSDKKVTEEQISTVTDTKSSTENKVIASKTEVSVKSSADQKTTEKLSLSSEGSSSVVSPVSSDSSFSTIAIEKMDEGNAHEMPEDREPDQYTDLEKTEGDPSEDEYNKQEYDGIYDPSKSKDATSKKPNEVVEISKLDDAFHREEGLDEFAPRNKYGSDDVPLIPVVFPEQEDGHFFFYFLSMVLIVMAGYLLFHNKQKIIALIVEGRHERRRRSHGAGYKKLDTK